MSTIASASERQRASVINGWLLICVLFFRVVDLAHVIYRYRSNGVRSLNRPLWSTFVSPFLDPPTTAAQPNFTLPPCYTLPTPPPPPLTKIPNFGDESLLYIFYAFPRDQLAEHAAQELYNRNWRFHKELRMWITRDEGAGQRGQGFERGYYSVWVPERWERERREMVVRYEDLEERGAMPVAGAGNAGNGASAVGGPVGVGVGVVGGGAQQGTIGGAAVASQQPGPSAVQQAQAAVAAGLGLPGVLGAPGIGVGVGNGAAVQQVLEKALRGGGFFRAMGQEDGSRLTLSLGSLKLTGLPPNSSLPPSQPTAGIPPTSQPAIQSLLAQFNMNPSSLSVPQLALLQQLQQQWPQLQPGAGARP